MPFSATMFAPPRSPHPRVEHRAPNGLARIPSPVRLSRPPLLRRLLFAALLILVASGSLPAQIPENALPALAPRPDAWTADGPVHAMTAANGTLYLGGEFTWIAPRGPRVSAVDVLTGDRLTGLPPFTDGAVRAIAPDDRGGWFLGGSFTLAGNLPRTNLVRLLPDLSVDPDFVALPDGPVHALALRGATLFVGGDFTTVGGLARARLAALHAGTGNVESWNPGANGLVTTLQLSPGGDVLRLGGAFTLVAGQGRQRLAAFDPATGALTSWAPTVDGDVLALAADDDLVFVGGAFGLANGALRRGLAAFRADTGLLHAIWNPTPADGPTNPPVIRTLDLQCQTLLVGGTFSNVGGATRRNAAALDTLTGLATAWDPRIGTQRLGGRASAVHALARVGDLVYVAGAFNSAGSEFRSDLVALDGATGQLLAWNPRLDGQVRTLASNGRTLLAATDFGRGGVERRNLAALDELTGDARPWNPTANGPVHALLAHGNRIIVGGPFTQVGGQDRPYLVAVDAASGAVGTDWSGAANGPVHAFATGPDRLFVGGAFTTINGITRIGLAALDPDNGFLLAGWSPRVDGGTVRSLLERNGRVYAAGSFTQLGFQSRSRLGAIDAVTGTILAWNPGANGEVRALAAPDASVNHDVVYAGGAFTLAGGQAAGGLVALHPVTGQPLPWLPSPPGGPAPGATPDVRALAVAGPLVHIGGGAFAPAGLPRFGLASVTTNGTVTSWSPASAAGSAVADSPAVLALLPRGRGVAAGGVDGLALHPDRDAPTLLAPPKDREPLAGGSFRLDAAFAGSPAPSLQWQLNGFDLAGETNASLVRTNLQLADTGTYRIIAVNAAGSLTAEGRVVVLEPPLILVQPFPVTASPGSNVTLSVFATGHPAPVYQWRLNGIPIPGAHATTLVLANTTPRSGGRYSVGVANRAGARLSDSAAVTINAPLGPFANAFAARGTLGATSGAARGSNVGATREITAGEPLHAGKPGGASVWARWVAPASGLATFTTRGSAFDTLLAIYTNSTLAQLRPVEADEDRGGFLTSRAVFQAVAGVEYQIAIDGLGGATGNFILSWETDTAVSPGPFIATPPVRRTVAPGGTTSFFVDVRAPAGAPTPTWQWYFGCTPLRGATNATLLLTNVQPRQAGYYHVAVAAPDGRVLETVPVPLEVGGFTDGRSYDKLEDLRTALTGAAAASPGAFAPASIGGAPLFLLSLGSIVTHTFSTSTNSPGLLTPDCDILTGAATFLSFQPAQSGVILVDTIGSGFDTVLSVFRYVDPLQLAANELACDDNGAPDRVRSRLALNAEAGRQYLVRVSGVSGARGRAQINWQLGVPPSVVQANTPLTATAGTRFALDSGLSVPDGLGTTYQWFVNGVPIPDGTNAMLTLDPIAPDQAGTYTVIAGNFAGSISSTRAVVAVRLPLHLLDARWEAPGRFAFRVAGHPGDAYRVEFTSALQPSPVWTTLATGVIPVDGSPVPLVDAHALPPGAPPRFYRVRPQP